MKSILTATPVGQRLAAILAAVGVALLLAIALPGQAQASMTGCVSPTSQGFPDSCVRIVGAGLYVNNAAGGVNLSPRQSVRGHFHVWGPGLNYYTGDDTYWNQSWWHTKLYWGRTVTINRSLPSGSVICAAFYDTSRGWRNPACGTIHP